MDESITIRLLTVEGNQCCLCDKVVVPDGFEDYNVITDSSKL